jgi:hypothetical protein
MEGAESHVPLAVANPAQVHVLADHADNIDRRFQMFDKVH